MCTITLQMKNMKSFWWLCVHKTSLIWRSCINISFLACIIVWLLLTWYKYFLRAVLTLCQIDPVCSSEQRKHREGHGWLPSWPVVLGMSWGALLFWKPESPQVSHWRYGVSHTGCTLAFAGNPAQQEAFLSPLSLQCWLSHSSMQCLWRHTSLHAVLCFIIMSWVLIKASQL